MFFRQKYLNVNITASPFLSFSAFGLQEWGKNIYFANMKKDELKQEVERVVGHELREARDFELLLVPSDSFGCEGFVRIAYCVTTEMIERSLPAFKKLAEAYGR